MWWVNKKRDEEAAATGSASSVEYEREAIENGMLDVIELDDRRFRYLL